MLTSRRVSAGFHRCEIHTRVDKSAVHTSNASIYGVVASGADVTIDIVDDSENGALSKRRFCCPLGNLMYCHDTLVSDAAAAAGAADIAASSSAVVVMYTIAAGIVVILHQSYSYSGSLALSSKLVDEQVSSHVQV